MLLTSSKVKMEQGILSNCHQWQNVFFLPWQLKQNHDMGNVIVDDEFELLLLRGSKFIIESMSFEPEPIHKRKLLKYRDIPCYDHLPVFKKTYTMRLISQPSFEELKNGYAK